MLPEQEVDFHRVSNGPSGRGSASGGGGLRDVRADLEGAVNSIFKGGPAQRRAVVERLYAKARTVQSQSQQPASSGLSRWTDTRTNIRRGSITIARGVRALQVQHWVSPRLAHVQTHQMCNLFRGSPGVPLNDMHCPNR